MSIIASLSIALAISVPAVPLDAPVPSPAPMFDGSAGDPIAILLLDDYEIPLISTGYASWQGIFSNTNPYGPGAIVSQSYDGEGQLITRIVLGRSNPVEWQYAGDLHPEQYGDPENPIMLIPQRRVCGCDAGQYACGVAKCDNGDSCGPSGGPSGTCYWFWAQVEDVIWTTDDTAQLLAE